MTKWIFSTMFLMIVSPAWGGFEAHLNIFDWGLGFRGQQLGDTDQFVTDTQLRMGYLADGLFLGVAYNSNDNRLSVQRKRESYGMSIGYHLKDVMFNFTYYFRSGFQLSNSVELRYGSGWAIDLGPRWDIYPNVFVGFLVSFRSFEYPEVSSGGLNFSSQNKVQLEYLPAFSIGVRF